MCRNRKQLMHEVGFVPQTWPLNPAHNAPAIKSQQQREAFVMRVSGRHEQTFSLETGFLKVLVVAYQNIPSSNVRDEFQ